MERCLRRTRCAFYIGFVLVFGFGIVFGNKENGYESESDLTSKMKSLDEMILRIQSDIELTKVNITSLRHNTEEYNSQALLSDLDYTELHDQLTTAHQQLATQRERIIIKMNSVSELNATVINHRLQLEERRALKRELEERWRSMTLGDVIQKSAVKLGSAPEKLIGEAVEKLVPAASEKVQSVNQISQTHPFVATLVSILIYSFAALSMLALIQLYIQWPGRVALGAIILLLNFVFSLFYLVLAVFNLALRTDTLVTLRASHELSFVCFQLGIAFAYLILIALHAVLLSLDLNLARAFDLLVVILVTEHFFVYIWAPSLEDEVMVVLRGGNFAYYTSYSALFYMLFASRVKEVLGIPHDQLIPFLKENIRLIMLMLDPRSLLLMFMKSSPTQNQRQRNARKRRSKYSDSESNDSQETDSDSFSGDLLSENSQSSDYSSGSSA
eukprot:CAMPEP_0182449628 /NCGR_PEP_ID=MMETSP1172-20130603/35630_1 /TAXON_ID=708627 /ORGANISM="Timspurckia oligopyrenoides, Strain CCMP3278" /LENGTH=442 /DNA_ID=CAMNT_0024646959 /DNA_START=118 /DNA_END=1446 /DNA_ORIENTATION=+